MWLAWLSLYRYVQYTKRIYATSPCLFEQKQNKSIESPLICFNTACRWNPLSCLQVCKQAKPKTSGVNSYISISTFYYKSAAWCRAAFILFMYGVKCIYTKAKQHQHISAGSAWLLGFMFRVKIHWITFTWTCYAILWRIHVYGMMIVARIVLNACMRIPTSPSQV